MSDAVPEPGFVTITKSRYGGAYEPGLWIAIAVAPHALPRECLGNDVECAEFFRERRDEIGGGDTPQAAYEDMLRRVAERGHT